MQTEYLIDIKELCTYYNVKDSFIYSLQQTGLIEISFIDDTGFIESEQLAELEKYVHLYYDLDINIEGIETINHLLRRIASMRNEIFMLRSRLGLYENNEKHIQNQKTRKNGNRYKQ